jgi:hypothetical protein
MNRVGLEKLLYEIKTCPEYTIQDLFKIRDALVILQDYGLVDLDLLLEVMKFINQKAENKS